MITESKNSPTLTRSQRPLPIRAIEWTANVLQRCGLPAADLSEEKVLKAAQSKTGLSDWGDEGFRVPLRLLLKDYAADERLTYLARWGARQRFVNMCANRLLTQDEVKRHPEILEVPIRRPLFVVGLPRTGTTLLYNLLAQDPHCRPLLTWEAFGPSLSAADERKTPDPRIRRAKMIVKAVKYAAPQLEVAHPMDPLGPEECLALLACTFVTIFLADAPSYREWLMGLSREEIVTAYQHFKRQLQALLWRRGGDHWVLKSPAHLFALDALVDVFPDGCIVQTHRDPLEVVPSGCSLTAIFQGLNYAEVIPAEVADYYLTTLLQGLDRAMKARETMSSSRVFDMHFQDLMQDPIGCVRRIYRHFDYEMTVEMEQKMQRLLQEKPRHKHGVHRYELEQFGLDADKVNRAFAPYCERFGIRSEQRSS